VDWLGEVMARGPKSGEEAAEAAVAGLEQCRRFGVTRVLDITRHPREVRRALAGKDVEVVSFAEVTGMAMRRGRAKGMIEAGCDVAGLAGATNLSFGLSPHAPYSTELGVYRACAEACERLGWGMMTHLAEVEEEWEFVERHTGVFRDLWDRLGDWSEDVERATGGWCGWMGAAGLERSDVIAAHLNHITEMDEVGLEAFGFSGVHCPRTHRYFGRGRLDVESKSRSIMNWHLGTDSLASCPDLNLMEDMREVASTFPSIAAWQIWQMGSGSLGTGEAALMWNVGPCDNPLSRVLGRG
jgi:cytosine/adenosine deaminase-related metal-dependent hydrolase